MRNLPAKSGFFNEMTLRRDVHSAATLVAGLTALMDCSFSDDDLKILEQDYRICIHSLAIFASNLEEFPNLPHPGFARRSCNPPSARLRLWSMMSRRNRPPTVRQSDLQRPLNDLGDVFVFS